MNIGISTASFYPLETELALEEIGKAGIKTAEIFFNAECELKESFVDILTDIKEHYEMNIVAIHPTMSLAEPFMIFSNYQRRFDESLRKFNRYGEVAAALGATYIILHGGKPNGKLTDEEYCERYMQLKSVTRKNGVTVLQENVAKYRAGDVEFMRIMRDILGKEAEFCLDIKQAVRSGNLPYELTEEFIDNIHHFHISDHSIASDCMLPGNGRFDFKAFFRLIKMHNYKGSAMIEVYRDAYKDYDEIFNSHKNICAISKKNCVIMA